MRIISRYSSLTLDGLRILAALVVFIFHLYKHWGFSTIVLSQVAHMAVVIFFALSGFVIAYTTSNKNRGAAQYFQARFSRLYSIVLPSLIIGLGCELIIKYTDPTVYSEIFRNAMFPRYIISSLFLNEIWFLSAAPPILNPLWSLSYEFWYYMVFGAWFYRNKDKNLKSYLILLISILIAGPKILIMMPIWLMGYAAYHITPPKLSIPKSIILVLFSLLVALYIAIYFSGVPMTLGTSPLYFASQFVSDWIIGFAISVALWLLPQEEKSKSEFTWTSKFRKVADLTFPLYVLHNPLIILWDSMFGKNIKTISNLQLPLLAILIVCLSIGYILEQQRTIWIKIFNYAFFLPKKLKNYEH